MNAIQPIIDESLALQNAGGNADLAQELYRMLQEELPGYQDTLQECSRNADYAALYQHVHKLNGSATYCGVPALKQAAQTFETHLKQGETQYYAEDLALLLEQIRLLMKIPSLSLVKTK